MTLANKSLRRVFTLCLLTLLLTLCTSAQAKRKLLNPQSQPQSQADVGQKKKRVVEKEQRDKKRADAKKEVDKKETEKKGREKKELQKGRILKRTYKFEAAGKEMEYALYVPKSFTSRPGADSRPDNKVLSAIKKYPLIVALHGLYSYPRQILGYPGFVRHAEQHGYILVAPMGYNRRGWYGSLGKGGGRRRSDPENLGELSEKDVLNVLELTRKQFPIDKDRIYLFGHSMGGGGAMHLAIKYPNIWAAMAPVAPAASRRLRGLEKAKHIPAIVIQGDNDRLVPVRGTRKWIDKMKELGMEHRYIEVKDGDHVSVAFKHFDDIFEFFNKHPKPSNSRRKEKQLP